MLFILTLILLSVHVVYRNSYVRAYVICALYGDERYDDEEKQTEREKRDKVRQKSSAREQVWKNDENMFHAR